MQTILVPTDFSASAKNAAIYAINLAAQLKLQKIILYNAYLSPPVMNEPAGVPVIPVTDLETFKTISTDGLEQFTQSLKSICPSGVTLEQKSEFGDIVNDIDEICETTEADLVVLGITGTSKMEELLIGSTAVSVVKRTKVPVIIVPGEAQYASINNIMLACDFKNVAETIPVHAIKSILDATDAALHVLNVYEEVDEVSPDKAKQKELLQTLFQEYEPGFHFVKNEDFTAGINEFVTANSIDLIIAVPKKHGFLHTLFREGHAKKLAFHSKVPLMYIHDEDL